MKNGYLGVLLVISVVSLVACQKNSAGFDQGGKTSLWPIKAGNTWIYKDSVFNDTVVTNTFFDTVTVTSQYVVAGNGQVMYGISNPNGWFPSSGTYLGVDPYNSTIYEIDSASSSPYIFFGTVSQDGELIGTGSDYSNPACPNNFSQYGFVTTYPIAGYTCLANIQYTANCNTVNTEQVIIYLTPGVGVVRIEDYQTDSTSAAVGAKLHLSYTHTLLSSKLN
jgi:hypothetical protein